MCLYKRQITTFVAQYYSNPQDSISLAFITEYCARILNRDSCLVLFLGLNCILCWLPYSTINVFQRFNCLLYVTHENEYINVEHTLWPTQTVWLCSELFYLLGDFSIQLVVHIVRLCDSSRRTLCLQKNTADSTVSGSETSSDDSKMLSDDEIRSGDAQMKILARMDTNHAFLHARTPSEDGQTSQNISPLPISHTISDAVRQTTPGTRPSLFSSRRTRSYRSNPSPYPSPLTNRIVQLNSGGTQQNPYTRSVQYNRYIEPKSSMVLLTYSPRARHPYREKQPKMTYQLPPNTPNSDKPYHWSITNHSPPPLPEPPAELTGAATMIGDSSIYSTPHGSPVDFRHTNLRTQLVRANYRAHSSPMDLTGQQRDSKLVVIGEPGPAEEYTPRLDNDPLVTLA
ncbi:hypothetical protein P879_06257 [Paragonimus westermani]|uniref:Uncharacterized protein n=1 Tax=Paragonimus westermani TaxID=34504 RepID=A0A8T0D117_9TREM|nr:hypothetical protein P879_06257 [Paragonimus westermani]